MQNRYFKNAKGDDITPHDVVKEIILFMHADLKKSYTIVLGTDSENMKDRYVDYVTAIVIHREGNGGRYFWRRNKLPQAPTLRDRMWQEVLISLDVAKEYMSLIKQFDVPQFNFEIHVDIGEHGKTHSMIQELVGFIRANDFQVKIKPNSYAASNVADRHNRTTASK